MGFEEGSHLVFFASHDVSGDGSIVIVPAFGRIPGSVIIFVTLPNGPRYVLSRLPDRASATSYGNWKDSPAQEDLETLETLS